MYIPQEFLITNPQVIANFLEQHSFGQLTAILPGGGLAASHVPFVLENLDNTLYFHTHLANENPLSQLPNGCEVMLVFTGEHGYVSSSWYGHPNVPTWNYQAVHVYGTLQKQTPDELYAQLKTLTRIHESTVDGHINPETLPQRMIQGYLQHITGFRIQSNRMEAAFKLSQNRNAKDFAAIIEQLKKRTPALAEEMLKYYQKGEESGSKS